ncbi:MAG: DUF2961 domain-containing protein [Acetobacteraceae bacterium]|nr:DUF2961 domain-containing protein [Acetobacteraceae bacterium]
MKSTVVFVTIVLAAHLCLAATPKTAPRLSLPGGAPTGTIDTAKNELVTVESGRSQDLLNLAPGKPGYVDSLWMAGSGQDNFYDAMLNVFVDGERTPSISTDIGDLCLLAFTQGSIAHYSTSHLVAESVGSNGGDCVLKYPIPYRRAVHITLTNVDPGSLRLWSQARYYSDVSVPYKLWSSAIPLANRLRAVTPEQQGSGAVRFLNLPQGGGWVVMHNIIYSAARNFTYLENNPVIYLNGRTPGAHVSPQYDSSGTEDYFLSSFYYGAVPASSPFAAISEKGHEGGPSPNSISTGLDLLAYTGGVRFDNGVLMRLERGNSVQPGVSDTDVDISYCVLYYTPN